MRAEALLQKLRSLGVQLTPYGDRIHYKAPKGVLTPELRQELMEYKEEIIALLRYKTLDAVFYPYIGRQVRVPTGEGKLVQVFKNRAAVVIDGRVRFFNPADVEPVRAKEAT